MKVDAIKNIPNKDSTDDQWIIWHGALKKFGKKNANLIFLEAWNSRTEKGGIIFSSKANTEKLRDYLEKQGVSLDKGFADYSATFIDGMDDFFTSAFNIGKYAGIGASAVVLIIIAVILYVIIKNPEAAGKLALTYASGGAAAPMMK